MDLADGEALVKGIIGTSMADTNLDHKVKIMDLGNLANKYGLPGGFGDGDTDGNGVLNIIDLGNMANDYGKEYPVSAVGVGWARKDAGSPSPSATEASAPVTADAAAAATPAAIGAAPVRDILAAPGARGQVPEWSATPNASSDAAWVSADLAVRDLVVVAAARSAGGEPKRQAWRHAAGQALSSQVPADAWEVRPWAVPADDGRGIRAAACASGPLGLPSTGELGWDLADPLSVLPR